MIIATKTFHFSIAILYLVIWMYVLPGFTKTDRGFFLRPYVLKYPVQEIRAEFS